MKNRKMSMLYSTLYRYVFNRKETKITKKFQKGIDK